MRILGIDPGTQNLGFGCIEVVGRQLRALSHGTVVLSSKLKLEERLKILHDELQSIVVEFKPQVMVVERIFFAKNALSALKLGHARGVVLLVAATNQLELVEVTPAEVKRVITGNGAADKEQVAKMVQLLVGKQSFQTLDASDALALALCHVQNFSTAARSSTQSETRSRKSRSLAQSLAHRINR